MKLLSDSYFFVVKNVLFSLTGTTKAHSKQSYFDYICNVIGLCGLYHSIGYFQSHRIQRPCHGKIPIWIWPSHTYFPCCEEYGSCELLHQLLSLLSDFKKISRRIFQNFEISYSILQENVNVIVDGRCNYLEVFA